MRTVIRRVRWTWVLWFGNVWKCNREYWGWIKMKTAWEVAGGLATMKRKRGE